MSEKETGGSCQWKFQAISNRANPNQLPIARAENPGSALQLQVVQDAERSLLKSASAGETVKGVTLFWLCPPQERGQAWV